MVHWLFATGLLLVGLCLLCEAVVGEEVWRQRPWRRYLWPGLAFSLGVLLWPVMAFFTNSSIHMYAHGSWAEVLMLAGGAELESELNPRTREAVRGGRPIDSRTRSTGCSSSSCGTRAWYSRGP
jgi:hypothetical protein